MAAGLTDTPIVLHVLHRYRGLLSNSFKERVPMQCQIAEDEFIAHYLLFELRRPGFVR